MNNISAIALWFLYFGTVIIIYKLCIEKCKIYKTSQAVYFFTTKNF